MMPHRVLRCAVQLAACTGAGERELLPRAARRLPLPAAAPEPAGELPPLQTATHATCCPCNLLPMQLATHATSYPCDLQPLRPPTPATCNPCDLQPLQPLRPATPATCYSLPFGCSYAASAFRPESYKPTSQAYNEKVSRTNKQIDELR